jgi:hypothetical protein
MREKHPAKDSDVDPSTPIWRYFDLPKFIAFLEHRGLWFSRADLLGDPLEGSVTRAREAERQRFLENPPEGRSGEELEAIFHHKNSSQPSLRRLTLPLHRTRPASPSW